MASELKVDKFTGVTTAGSIDVTGEGNSTTTNLQQGLCKMWAKLDGSGTIGLDDSFNVGSITDEGTGEYSFTFSNNMNNANFNVAHASDNQMQIHRPSRTTTTSVGINCRNQNNTSEDRDHLFSNVHGDLA